MEKEFIPYELALKLKELGFNEKCFGVFINSVFQPRYKSINSKFNPNAKLDKRDIQFCTAPLWQQAFDWFRDKHGLCYFINHSGRGYCSGWEDLGNNEHGFGNYSTYKEARLECLKKLIEIVKN